MFYSSVTDRNLMVDGYYNVTLFSLSLLVQTVLTLCSHSLNIGPGSGYIRARGQPGKQSEADRGYIRTTLQQQYGRIDHNQLITWAWIVQGNTILLLIVAGIDLDNVHWTWAWQLQNQQVCNKIFPNCRLFGDDRELDLCNRRWCDLLSGGLPWLCRRD